MHDRSDTGADVNFRTLANFHLSFCGNPQRNTYFSSLNVSPQLGYYSPGTVVILTSLTQIVEASCMRIRGFWNNNIDLIFKVRRPKSVSGLFFPTFRREEGVMFFILPDIPVVDYNSNEIPESYNRSWLWGRCLYLNGHVLSRNPFDMWRHSLEELSII